ncbi:uncharacterized protein [Dysidea avara]|uniref:uncharacterized protein isoform X2 n=1 Tax=Dysidea avara TaxID=196820 RepID=UPI003327F89B
MELMYLVIVLMCSVTYSGEQTCTDSNVEVLQVGSENDIPRDHVAIIPNLGITCNGRITNITVRLQFVGETNDYPYIQVWRQTSSVPMTYNKIGEVQIQQAHVQTIRISREGRRVAFITLTGNNRMSVQSGDVIGFYVPSKSRFLIKTIPTNGYVLYLFTGSATTASLNLNNAISNTNERQPLIQFTLERQCATLPNERITSCESGSMEVGYEGDTCTFSCNTGYVLSGNPTRTCQNDGSWNVPETTCRRTCTSLTETTNGTINCSLGDDGVPSYEDTCSFACNTGYVLTGIPRRTCQSDGSWSGLPVSCTIMVCPSSSLPMNSMLAESCSSTYQSMCDLQCEEGFNSSGDPSYMCDVLSDGSVMWMTSGGGWSCGRIPCPSLTDPNNGIINCSLGDDGAPSYEDTCSFTCNTGYVLTGSDTRTCQSNGSWSGSDDVCRRVPCPSLTDPNNGMMTCSLGDDGIPSYEDTCSFTCNTGYVLTGSDTRTCQSDRSWNGNETNCSRVLCPSLTDPNNGTINCSLGDDGIPSYEDTCSFTCNTGYKLTGSDTRTCQSDENWSGSDTLCTDTQCLILTTPSNGEISSCSFGSIEVGYEGDTCNFTCNTGYELTGSDTRTCQSDGSWSGTETMCRRESTGELSGSFGAVIGGIIGGVVVAIVIIVVVVVVIVWMRRSRKNQVDIVDYGELKNGTVSIAAPAAVNGKQSLDVESLLTIALAGIDDIYDDIVSYDKSKGIYYMSANEIAKSLQKEENIYETPYKHKEDCGPVYCVPADDEKKIYEEFAGKKFRKLLHREVKIGDELGSGEFGIVARAMWKPSSRKKVEVAVKTLNANVNTKDRVRFLQEAAIMCQFDHLNVVKLHGVVTDEPVMIVLEYVSRGDLRNLLIQLRPSIGVVAHEKLPLLLLKSCQEIAAGMAYLSGKQFVHRDLAARNILVSESVTCKIADFGMSRDLLDENYYVTSGGKIPVKWTAPEAIHYRKYSGQSDVWSYGIVLYEIWSLGCEPYEWLNLIETVEKLDTGYRLPPPPGCPRAIYRVMIKCWDPEPKSRPQFGQITQLLTGNYSYVLGWSDEDKQYGGEDAMKLGGHLECANNLYYDLQMKYKELR